ncbi:MAG: hypothetical protein WAU14_07195 [Dokdonella sp.]|nr:hypothetical protein [Dokdonella sp.]
MDFPIFSGHTMLRPSSIAFILLALLLSDSAVAVSSIESASTCLTDSTNGRDRKELVKWIFLAMSKHPEISGLASSTPANDEESNRRVGKLVTRLLAEDCALEVKAMVSEHGPASLSQAFEVLGRVAMQELMTQPDVNAAFSGLDRFTDQARINRAIGAK